MSIQKTSLSAAVSSTTSVVDVHCLLRVYYRGRRSGGTAVVGRRREEEALLHRRYNVHQTIREESLWPGQVICHSSSVRFHSFHLLEVFAVM